jgi:hypothetical protein
VTDASPDVIASIQPAPKTPSQRLDALETAVYGMSRMKTGGWLTDEQLEEALKTLPSYVDPVGWNGTILTVQERIKDNRDSILETDQNLEQTHLLLLQTLTTQQAMLHLLYTVVQRPEILGEGAPALQALWGQYFKPEPNPKAASPSTPKGDNP